MLYDIAPTYYWAWIEEDNVGHRTLTAEPKFFRVWRSNPRGKDEPVTEPMSRKEAMKYCERIIKLTQGRGIDYE
jgi:hypothetical protein